MQKTLNLSDYKFVGVKGDFIDIEYFDRIWSDFLKFYNQNIEQILNNIEEIYKLTGNEHGYSALKQNWKSYRDNPHRNLIVFSRQDILYNINEKVSCVFNWLYTKNKYSSSFHEGFTGLLFTFRLNVDKGDKLDNFEYSYSYNLSIDIGCGEHNSI